MSRHKRHQETDETMKIYPDITPGLSRSIMDSQIITNSTQNSAKTNAAKSRNDTIKNNRGWSK